MASLAEETTIAELDAPELSGIEESRAEQIKATFEPMAETLAKFEAAYREIIEAAGEEITGEVTAAARRLRLDVGKVRIATEKARKEMKEEYLRAGKAIDGVSNILKWAVVDKEKKLKEIEDHFEIKEVKRLDAIRVEREAAISLYVDDTNITGLAQMPDDVWDAYLSAKKKDYEDRLVAERQAEEARAAKEKAETEERERIEKENERLKAEAAEREQKEKTERKKSELAAAKRLKAEQKKEAERKAKEKAEREEREAKEAKREKDREAERQAERRKLEKLEAELRDKKEAEQKREDAEEVTRQAKLKRGDAANLQALTEQLSGIKTNYSFKSAKNKKMFVGVVASIDAAMAIIKG